MMRRFMFLMVFLSALGTACGPGKPKLANQLDYDKSLDISNAAVRDIMKNDGKDLFALLDVGFVTRVKGPSDMGEVLKNMYSSYGRPLSCDFENSAAGIRVDGTWRRPRRVFWYSTKTTKYPKGRYYLAVEVVRAFSSDEMDVAGFGFLDAKKGIPQQLH